jgi:hypothetical protein
VVRWENEWIDIETCALARVVGINCPFCRFVDEKIKA